MYIKEWDSFLEASKAIFVDSPTRTRFVTKYRHCDSQLVLKVTDDNMCVKYKTDQISDLKRLEELNSLFMRLATNRGLFRSIPLLLADTNFSREDVK